MLLSENDHMDGFISSLLPFFRRFFVESLLLGAAFIITFISITIYIHTTQKEEDVEIPPLYKSSTSEEQKKSIMIDVSGAVNKEGVFELSQGARLKDALDLAKGISNDADKGFFNRNFNLARYVLDQEKIYVPSLQETETGIISERKQLVDYLLPQTIPLTQIDESPQERIKINSASSEEIDTLPGIGQSTAEKIIQNRPFTTIDELLTKKILKKNVFEQVRELVDL